MKERGIIFNGDMVRAILEGRKTQTRRPIKTKVKILNGWNFSTILDSTDRREVGKHCFSDSSCITEIGKNRTESFKCPYGYPGDRLWVRETWADLRGTGITPETVAYFADAINKHGCEDGDTKRCRLDYGVKWKPSIHMPRWASRITLEIVSVRVERVQEIGLEGCLKEGIGQKDDGLSVYQLRGRFHTLWDSIYSKSAHGWDANPWVWVIEFKRV